MRHSLQTLDSLFLGVLHRLFHIVKKNKIFPCSIFSIVFEALGIRLADGGCIFTAIVGSLYQILCTFSPMLCYNN